MGTRFVGEIPTLRLTHIELSNFILEWDSLDHGGDVPVGRYHIFRSADGGEILEIGTSTTLTYTDTGADTANVTYAYYIVCEYSFGNMSLRSNIVEGCFIVSDYVYLLGGDGMMHSIDIRVRATPTFVDSQDMSADLGAFSDVSRMLIDDLHLYVGVGSVADHHMHVLNYLNGVLDYRYKLQGAVAKTSAIVLRRNISAIENPPNAALESWDITGDDAAVYRNGFMDGLLVGQYHPDSIVFDPESKILYHMAGGDLTTTVRWMCGDVADNDLVSSRGGAVQIAEIFNSQVASGRMLVQQRTGLASILWILLDAGWYGYAVPLSYSDTSIASFAPPDITNSGDFSRCYLRGNYAFMCMKAAHANRYGVEIYDMTDPATPTRMSGLVGLNGTAADILFVDDDPVKYAYVLEPTGKTILVYDITDVASPSLLSTVVLSELSANMDLIARKNNVSQYDGGNGFMPDVP